MRIVTLLPAATEIVAALGAEDRLVGISHECDWPPSIRRLPRVTTTPIDREAPSGAIDHAVREALIGGRPVIALDGDQLRALAPDLIITQGLCQVCAVDDGQAFRLADAIAVPPRILSLSATTVDGIYDDVRNTGALLDCHGEAERLVHRMQDRLAALSSPAPRQPYRVVCIEWLDPPYLAGHWVPELVAAAGAIDIGGQRGSHSTVRPWQEIRALDPEIVFVLLCGMDVPRAMRELNAVTEPMVRDFLSSRPIWVLDGNACTSRPGPRVVDGAVRIHAALLGREMDGLVRFVPAGLAVPR